SAPSSLTWSRYIALTVPTVPTGMKAGVRMTPRGMEISPRRALPSVALRVNWKRSCMSGVPEEQAGVAVGIEAIARRDGVIVSRAHGVEAGEGGDKHEQRRPRQMKIGHQRVDRA